MTLKLHQFIKEIVEKIKHFRHFSGVQQLIFVRLGKPWEVGLFNQAVMHRRIELSLLQMASIHQQIPN